MMVAFRYDNDAVGSLYYSREIPSLFRGLRWSKLFGRERRHHVRIERRCSSSSAASGLPRLVFPGFRDIRGYQAMYRDFVASIRDRPPARDEPRAGDRGSAADGTGLRRDRAARVTEHYDIVIIGSGAGGGTMAHALAETGARILLLERGDFVPQEDGELESGRRSGSTCAISRRSAGSTSAAASSVRTPTTTSAATPSSGAACSIGCGARTSRRVEHRDGVSPAWPIDYDTLAPYYDRAERLYHVRGQHGLDPTEPPRGPYPYAGRAARAGHGRDRRAAARAGPASVAAAARPAAARAKRTAASCATPAIRSSAASTRRARPTSAPCVRRCATAERHALDQRLRAPADHRSRAAAGWRRSRSSANGATVRVEAPLVRRVVRRRQFGGAAAAIGERSTPRGLANSSGLVGRRYMAHLATMMQGFHPFRPNATVFQKTVAINDFYLRGPHSRVSARPDPVAGADARRHGADRRTRGIPLWAYEAWVSRGVDWLVMSEDLPRLENRVTVERDGRIRLRYRPNNLRSHRDAGRQRPSASCAGSASGWW